MALLTVAVLLAGCGGNDIERPGEGPAPTGPAAAPADATAACLALARSLDDLRPPVDLSQPGPTHHRMNGVGGLVRAAASYDSRLGTLEEAVDRVVDAAGTLDAAGLTEAVPAALAVCRTAGLPTEQGDGSDAAADAAAGCAAVARSRDLFAATDVQSVTFETNLRLGGAEELLIAASEAESRYQPVADAIRPVRQDLTVLALDRLPTSGARALATCGQQGLPHE
ncbi:hypothetical protein CC117_21175 [Parafrankia colletiae]|uniref:Uncharacterized protein n=1 Tax=Parafrankia colletiae TaxID=573497 RepID=A0A1S1QM91_9ACTN|nr:hypothetical protein [Parafrankia colletiae]MCK9900552.1 hypothetical protein [Frankia sp. Cpl3]OHV34709.1 hypothetical protein CC117_21175 [Parafrankia colletiae]